MWALLHSGPGGQSSLADGRGDRDRGHAPCLSLLEQPLCRSRPRAGEGFRANGALMLAPAPMVTVDAERSCWALVPLGPGAEPESPLTDQAPQSWEILRVWTSTGPACSPLPSWPSGPLALRSPWPLGLQESPDYHPSPPALSCPLPRGCSLLTQVFVCPQLTRGASRARPPLRLPAAGRDAVGQRGGLGHALDPPELR